MSDTAHAEEAALEKENRSLRQRVDELERTLSTIGSAAIETVPRPKVAWWKAALLGVLALASLAPPYLVLRDRWLENSVYLESVSTFWWETPLLKALPYPQYFLLIFLATGIAALVLLVLLWHEKPMLIFSNLHLGTIEASGEPPALNRLRAANYILAAAMIVVDLSAGWMIVKGRIPGWELILAIGLFVLGLSLRNPPGVALSERFQAHGRLWLDAALFVIAVCCALYAAFGEEKPNLIFYVLVVAAGLNVLRHWKDTPVLFWVSVASLVAMTWNLDSWHYVVIGDEYSFFFEILNILDNRTPWELVNTVFNGTFVYGTHPYLSSHIQNLFMKLFDNRNFGWRFSNPFLVAASLPFFYYFFKAFVPRRTALIVVVLLGFSHYLLSFSKIGYNNLQSFFAMGLVLAAFAWAVQSMTPLAFALTGLSMGLCFYIYPAALYLVPLPVIGFLFFMPPTNKEALKRWGWTVISAALLFYPLLVQPEYWAAKVAGTFMYTDAGNSWSSLAENVLRNVLFSGFSYLFIPEQTHYVSVGYLDLLSSAFVLIGAVLLFKTALQRNKSAVFLVMCFVMMFFIVGATHGRNFPTATRMFLLLPWFALFAALGIEWSVETAAGLFRFNSRTVITLLLGAIAYLNLYQAYVVDVRNMVQYHSIAPMFVKTVREIDANPRVPPKSYAFVSAGGWNTDGMQIVQRAYLVPASPRQIINLPVEGNQLPVSFMDLVSQRDTIVIIKADLPEDLITAVDIQLITWGKSGCEIRNGKGALQFQLWHSGDLDWLCK